MDSIYSRKRIKIPKVKGFYTNNKNAKKFFSIFIIIIIAFFTFYSIFRSINPIFEGLCIEKAREIGTYIINEASNKILDSIDYKNIVSIEENYIVDEKLEEEVFKKEKLQNINKIICKMKQDYQIAIYLADFEGLSYKEIGKILKKSDTYVKNLIHRAREKLKQLLRKEGITYEN